MTTNYANWVGKTVVDKNGDKIGTIADLYVDDDTEVPTWATVKSGLFGTKRHFAPIRMARETGDGIALNTTADRVKDAPALDTSDDLSPQEESRLWQHYLAADNPDSNSTHGRHDSRGRGIGDAGTTEDAREDSAARTENRDDTLEDASRDDRNERDPLENQEGTADTRRSRDTEPARNEQPRHGEWNDDESRIDDVITPHDQDRESSQTRKPAAEGVPSHGNNGLRLKKYTVTENVQVSVPVQREVVELENESQAGAGISEREQAQSAGRHHS